MPRKQPEWKREGSCPEEAKWLVARVGRAILKVGPGPNPMWKAETIFPFDSHWGQSATVEKAKLAAERKARLLIGTQAWAVGLEPEKA